MKKLKIKWIMHILLLLLGSKLNAQNVGVGSTTPTHKLHVAGNARVTVKPQALVTDSVVMRFSDGELRQISIARLIGQIDTDGDGIVDFDDPDIDGDGIANSLDSCRMQYGCSPSGCARNCNCTYAQGVISSLNCAGATNNGTLTSGTAASGVSSVIPYTGGNGGAYSAQTVSSTGVTGLTATLSAGSFASGNGGLTYTITGTPSSAGNASFVINIGGQSCTLIRNINSNLVLKDSFQGCPPSLVSCGSADCNLFGAQYNSSGGGTLDGIIWDASGIAQPIPGNASSEGVQFNLSSSLLAGVTYTIRVRWIAFGYAAPLVPMGFSVKHGGCTGTVLVSSPSKTPICSGPSSTCESWTVSTMTFTPTVTTNTINIVAWGGNGGNDFVLFDYIAIYQ